MTITEKAVNWVIDIANDDTHGYSQANRTGNPDYDCSSLVISAYQQAGIPLSCTYTGNMFDDFISNGFRDVTSEVNLSTGDGLLAGDVLLNVSSHTVIYIGDGKVVNARTDADGVSGDSTGTEIRIQSYWDFPWDYCLRLKSSVETVEVLTEDEPASEDVLIPDNTKGIGIAMLQGGLKYKGYNLGWYGVDGDAGNQYSYTNVSTHLAISHGDITEDTVKYLVSLC